MTRAVYVLVLLSVTVLAGSAFSQEDSPLEAPGEPGQAITLKEVLEDGGNILLAIVIMGFFALVMVIYFFLTVSPMREAPPKLVKRAATQIRSGDLRGAYQMCEGRDEMLAKVLISGLKMAGQERYIIQEAMESEGERGAAALWQKISYLNSVGVIAPLLGLLGTVWGMIGAFREIDMDSAQVRGMGMASHVSGAMITTAAGLLLAIPALLTYYYFRGRVLKIVSRVESQASEFVELIVRNQKQ